MPVNCSCMTIYADKSYIRDESGEPYHRRFAYARYEKYINDFREESGTNRFIIASGLRGTGKTPS